MEFGAWLILKYLADMNFCGWPTLKNLRHEPRRKVMYLQFTPYQLFLITKWKIGVIEDAHLKPEKCVGD